MVGILFIFFLYDVTSCILCFMMILHIHANYEWVAPSGPVITTNATDTSEETSLQCELTLLT